MRAVVANFGSDWEMSGAEIAEHLDDALKAPVRRIGAPRMPVPYAAILEDEFRVTDAHIEAAARSLVQGKKKAA